MTTGSLKVALAAVLLLVVGRVARAQDPVKLPGVKVTAPEEKPGARVVAGIVVDTAGNPIEGAEVTLPDQRRRMFTRFDGTFRFDSVRKGEFQMRARKIGYAAQVKKVTIDSIGGVARFSLLPLVQGLPAMVASATRRGLSGNVADMSMQSVPDATVRVLGMGMHTKTDVRGDFFLPVETGRYMVAIEKDSFATKLVSVAIPADSGRHINAWLMPGGEIEKEHFWNINDLGGRQAWVKPQLKVLYTREDLSRMKIEWASDAVLATATKFQQREAYDPDCMVVVNGGPEIANLSAITIDDVESIEVYPSFSSSLPSSDATASQLKMVRPGFEKAPRVQGGKFVWIDNSRHAAIENGARHCPGIYVWLR